MNRSFLAAALLAATTLTVSAQQEGPVPTQTLVSLDSKTPTVVTLDQVSARVNNREVPLLGFSPVKPNGLQVALLIDDGLRASVGTQLDELRQFITTLRPGTEVYVGYMQNGRVVGPSAFSTDYAGVAQHIRLPLGVGGANASPYFCLTDFIKRWPGAPEADEETPSSNGKARVVLMITNGVDPYNGSVSPMNQDSPYVAQAVTLAQRAGVAVYSIYYGNSGVRGNLASLSGQGYLQQVADGTGGRTFYQGTWSPVSIAPFLTQFQNALSESYIATYAAVSKDSKTLDQFKLNTTLRGVKIHAPSQVHPGLVITSASGAAMSNAGAAIR